MSAPRPTQPEIDALLAAHGGELTEVETEELYLVARRPTRDEASAYLNGTQDDEQGPTACNNLLVACVQWPAAGVVQAAIEACPGLNTRLAPRVADDVYPDDGAFIKPGDAIPPEHTEAAAAARLKGAVAFMVADGRLLGFKGPGRFDFDACTVSIRKGQHYEGPEALALRCVVEPAKDVFREINKARPGVALLAGLGVYSLGQHKGAVRSGKLRASSK